MCLSPKADPLMIGGSCSGSAALFHGLVSGDLWEAPLPSLDGTAIGNVLGGYSSEARTNERQLTIMIVNHNQCKNITNKKKDETNCCFKYSFSVHCRG